MSVKYSWSRQNGAAVPPVRFMSIEPAEDYYKGMPLKLKEKGIVEPTDGDPEYICMAQYDPDAEIQPLEIPVQEVFPDVIYEKINNDGTTEEVRFGSRNGGGGIKTVNGQEPDANGNVEVTAGVQSDMYETNPESMAFVKNNPIESGVVELAFDGTLDGKEYKEISWDGLTAYYVKMSDEFISNTDIVSVKLNNDGTGVTDVEYTDDIYEPTSGGYNVGENIEVVENTITISNDESTVVLDRGVWFVVTDASIMGGTGWIGGLGLTYNAKKVKTSLIPSHLHKWNDISDAPFYDRSKSEPLNFEFNGNLEDYETNTIMDTFLVKVSDDIPSVEQLVGGEMVIMSYGEEEVLLLTSENVGDMSSQGVQLIMIGFEDQPVVMIVYGDTSAMGVNLTNGVWFVNAGEQFYVKSLSNPNATITTGEIKKLDNKFIDAEWMATTAEVKGDAPFLEGTINSRDTMNGIFDAALNVGKKYLVIWDGVEYVCKANDYSELFGGSPGDLIGIGDLMIIAGQGGAGEPFFIFYGDDAVEHFTIAAAVEGEHTFAVYELVEAPVLLPNKFIDAEWMATSGQEQFEGEIVSNRTIQSASIGGGSNLKGYASNYDLIKEGDGLRVVWNGKDYNVTVKAATISAYGYTINVLYAGNYGAVLSHQGMESPVAATGEPFSITFGQTNIQTGEFEHELDVSVATEEATGVENTISIYAESFIVPLPEKFIPELTQVILISPSGKKFKTTVGDDGVLTTTEV